MAEAVYLEIGSKRVFAGSIDWPGWCRSGRDEESALEALLENAPRYKKAIGAAARGFSPPSRATAALRVVERLKGNATTDFGAPAVAPSSDDRPIGSKEAERLTKLLQACWKRFDATAKKAAGVELRKGPRGGGRDVDAIVRHVDEADRAYLSKLGGTVPKGTDTAELRRAFLDAFRARIRGEPITSRVKTPWLPRYAIRRSAWHALDHAWEIEDRRQ